MLNTPLGLLLTLEDLLLQEKWEEPTTLSPESPANEEITVKDIVSLLRLSFDAEQAENVQNLTHFWNDAWRLLGKYDAQQAYPLHPHLSSYHLIRSRFFYHQYSVLPDTSDNQKKYSYLWYAAQEGNFQALEELAWLLLREGDSCQDHVTRLGIYASYYYAEAGLYTLVQVLNAAALHANQNQTILFLLAYVASLQLERQLASSPTEKLHIAYSFRDFFEVNGGVNELREQQQVIKQNLLLSLDLPLQLPEKYSLSFFPEISSQNDFMKEKNIQALVEPLQEIFDEWLKNPDQFQSLNNLRETLLQRTPTTAKAFN